LVIATGFLYLYRDLFEVIARYALKRAYVESGDANVSIIWPSHFAQAGRSIEVRMGSSEISVFGMDANHCIWERWWAHMNLRASESLSNIDQFSKKSGIWRRAARTNLHLGLLNFGI
jgi:hypothetical protein